MSTHLRSAEETYVQIVDAMFDLGQGHRSGTVELDWRLWCRLRAMIPAAEKLGPVGHYKEDGPLEKSATAADCPTEI